MTKQYDDYINFVNRYRTQHDPDFTDLRRKWWCLQNPNGGYFACAFTQDEIVSTCYLSGKQVATSNSPLSAYEIGETWTSEKHRRKGLFSKLVSYCRELAFESDAQLIYGTPNTQSSPGYQKLGFGFCYDKNSYLLLIPNFITLILNRLIKQKREIRDISIEGCIISSLSESKKVSELSFAEYMDRTVIYERFNFSNAEYVKWRFAASPFKYRYFLLKNSKDEFLCSLRHGHVGNLSLIVTSEHYLNGVRSNTADIIRFIKTITRQAYKDYEAIYVRSFGAHKLEKLTLMVSQSAYIHRLLPVCYTFKTPELFRDINPVIARMKSFQLSDCDVG